MANKRTAALIQIMQIQDQIKRVRKTKRYRKIQQYVRILKSFSVKSVIKVEKPDLMGKMVELRKNSKTAKEYLETYELMLYEYDALFKKLGKRRSRLKEELFG